MHFGQKNGLVIIIGAGGKRIINPATWSIITLLCQLSPLATAGHSAIVRYLGGHRCRGVGHQ